MSFLEMMEKRHSCRKFLPKAVDRKDLEKIVEAGRLSPSGCNAQPWKFIIVDEKEAKDSLCKALVTEKNTTGAPWREDVSAFIVVVETKANVKPAVLDYYEDSQVFAHGDIGMAAMNMCYEAMDLGLDTCIIGMCSQKLMEEGLGIPSGNKVRLTIAVGYGDEGGKIPAKVRKPVEEICSFNNW